MIQSHLHLPDRANRRTKVSILYGILDDRGWHSTKELSRRVGHTFAVATHLLRKGGHRIQTERHPERRHQYRYRLLGNEQTR